MAVVAHGNGRLHVFIGIVGIDQELIAGRLSVPVELPCRDAVKETDFLTFAGPNDHKVPFFVHAHVRLALGARGEEVDLERGIGADGCEFAVRALNQSRIFRVREVGLIQGVGFYRGVARGRKTPRENVRYATASAGRILDIVLPGDNKITVRVHGHRGMGLVELVRGQREKVVRLFRVHAELRAVFFDGPDRPVGKLTTGIVKHIDNRHLRLVDLARVAHERNVKRPQTVGIVRRFHRGNRNLRHGRVKRNGRIVRPGYNFFIFPVESPGRKINRCNLCRRHLLHEILLDHQGRHIRIVMRHGDIFGNTRIAIRRYYRGRIEARGVGGIEHGDKAEILSTRCVAELHLELARGQGLDR